MLVFECPSCKTKMQAAEEYAGKTTVCPECNTPTEIPAAPPAATDGITADPPAIPTAVSTSEGARPKKKKPAADDDEEDDRPPRRRGSSSDAGKAAATGMSAVLIVVLVLGVLGCVAISVVAILIALLVPAVQKVREAASRAETTNNMKQLVLACHIHHDVTKVLPTPKVFPQGPQGKPSELSWRVSVLPYIEQDPMFRQFNQNLAWDDPANFRFVQNCPQVYDNKTRPELPRTETHFQYFTGPNTLFPTANSSVVLVGKAGKPENNRYFCYIFLSKINVEE